MAEILGLGMTHYPPLCRREEEMPALLRSMLKGTRVPEHAKDPRTWPSAMREEWGNDEGVTAARIHRERCFSAFRVVRERLDRFHPDAVLIFGDDQYENFVDDLVPPFCVYITGTMVSRPFAGPVTPTRSGTNIWNEPADTEFRHEGKPELGRWLMNRLSEAGTPLPYAYRLRYERGLAHAFINTLMYLDVDRRGFPFPVVPFHVNCYGGELVRSRGAPNPARDAGTEPDPPAPSPAACFDIGRAVGKALAGSQWRVAIIASSSWSHAFLTTKNHWIYPDSDSDRARLKELREGQYASWRELTQARIEDAGQHEFLNWVALAGAMSALDKRVEIIDWVESHVFNSSKCFAVFS